MWRGFEAVDGAAAGGGGIGVERYVSNRRL